MSQIKLDHAAGLTPLESGLLDAGLFRGKSMPAESFDDHLQRAGSRADEAAAADPIEPAENQSPNTQAAADDRRDDRRDDVPEDSSADDAPRADDAPQADDARGDDAQPAETGEEADEQESADGAETASEETAEEEADGKQQTEQTELIETVIAPEHGADSLPTNTTPDATANVPKEEAKIEVAVPAADQTDAVSPEAEGDANQNASDEAHRVQQVAAEAVTEERPVEGSTKVAPKAVETGADQTQPQGDPASNTPDRDSDGETFRRENAGQIEHERDAATERDADRNEPSADQSTRRLAEQSAKAEQATQAEPTLAAPESPAPARRRGSKESAANDRTVRENPQQPVQNPTPTSPVETAAAPTVFADRAAANAESPAEMVETAAATPAGTGSDNPSNVPLRASSATAARVETSGRAAQTTETGQVDRERFVQRVARAFRTIGGRNGTVRLKLSPPELGSLRLEITVRNGVMTARVEAETPTARNLLLDNLPALRDRLAQQDIKIEQFNVDLSDRSGGGLPEPSDDFPGSQDRQNHGQSAQGDAEGNAEADTPEQTGAPRRPGESTRLNVIV